MEIQEIHVTIGPDGRVRIEVHGAKGLTCLDLTQELEAALGNHIEDRRMTPEALEGPGAQTGGQNLVVKGR